MGKAAGTTRTPPDLDSDLTLEDLIAFGRDYLKEIEANEATEASARMPIDLPLNVLKQYLARSIDGLVLLQAEQARKTTKKQHQGRTSGRRDSLNLVLAWPPRSATIPADDPAHGRIRDSQAESALALSNWLRFFRPFAYPYFARSSMSATSISSA
jgi:hypothetical protein